MISATKTITTTASIIVAARPTESRWIYINPGANDTYIGGIGVTTVTGLPLKKSEIFAMYLPPLEDLYAVGSTGSHTINVMEPLT